MGLFGLPTYAYATDRFEHKKTYYLIVLRQDAADKRSSVLPQLNHDNKLYQELKLRVKWFIMNGECLIGIQCQDFSMVAADQMNTQSVLVLKNDEQKLIRIADNIVMGVNGEMGDISQFTQFVEKNVQLYKMRNEYGLNTAATVHFTRQNLSEFLKSGNPYVINMLIAGYDPGVGGQLYTMDFLAASVKVPFASHGFGGILCMGLLDRYYKPTLTESEAYDIIKTCVYEVHQRLFLNLPNFQVKLVNKNGIKDLPIITPATFIKAGVGNTPLSASVV
ncbi:proteasome subunit beta type-2-like isoform X2 [Plodia interpunctella]|nr:proteasome subunit beta type-2-like isoform X2 [Plodia interpunctella]